MPINNIIFDFGGVILRTEDRRPRTELAKQLGMTYEQLERLVYNGSSGVLAQLGKITPEQHWENICIELGRSPEAIPELQSGFWGGDILDTDFLQHIRTLRQDYTISLLSNAFGDLRTYLRDHWKIENDFDHVIISAEEGVMKPAPRIYEIALERSQTEPQESVFTDDMPQNVEAALSLGMHAIHFRNREQAKSDLDQLLSKT